MARNHKDALATLRDLWEISDLDERLAFIAWLAEQGENCFEVEIRNKANN